MIKSLAELKRKVRVGTQLKLVSAPEMLGHPHRYLGTTRRVTRVQGNCVVLEGGSYLYWGKAADYTFNEKGFTVDDGSNGVYKLTYEFVNQDDSV